MTIARAAHLREKLRNVVAKYSFERSHRFQVHVPMIDFGYSSPTLLNNLDILGIDPAKLDAMVLSHGHYDHFGGMVGFLRATQGTRKPKLPLYIGGEECFCSRQFTAGPTPLNFGALDRKAIAEADLVVTTAEGPAGQAQHSLVHKPIPPAAAERR